MKYILPLKEVNSSHLESVGGKNASIGEMLQHLTGKGLKVPDGFATTVSAYRTFLRENQLDKKITQALAAVNIQNLNALTKTSKLIRQWIMKAHFSPEFEKEIAKHYAKLPNRSVAVRSSATCEDLPTASFAGQQETFLNVKGLNHVLKAIKLVFASLFTPRSIAYRKHQHCDDRKLGISVGIQPMVRSDKGASGVIFTLDTESGFDQVILITAGFGLGEALVQGQVNPDEYIVYKPNIRKQRAAILQKKLGTKAVKMIYDKTNKPYSSVKTIKVPAKERAQFALQDAEIQKLAKAALLIETHYGMPMDIEWAKDGVTNELFILQARPETVKHADSLKAIEQYILSAKSKVVATGLSIGQRIGQGKARIVLNAKNMDVVEPGDVLVTDMTDPDWEPIMKKASAIVTNRGGRTCHAAIVARELGIPAVVGCGTATTAIKEKSAVTVSCAEGHTGYVYAGKIPFSIKKIPIKKLPKLPLSLCMNIGNPEKAFASQFLPNEGVGLARIEFIISNMIGIHPNAALQFKKIPKPIQKAIQNKISGYANPVEFYIEKLREGISMIAAAFYPKPVIFRFSDFKSNEYANLLGGALFEPQEENPMIGFRGASRYTHPLFQKSFELECRAFQRVRKQMQLTNAHVMIPFVRTVAELKKVVQLIASYGLKRGEAGLKYYMMCEVPSNVILADEFLPYVDGYSIGSNDLTQLVLGLDRDSSLVAPLFDERNAAIKILLKKVIAACNQQKKYIGICGQAPSDYPEFAVWLMREGIQSMSLNPDTVLETHLLLAKKK